MRLAAALLLLSLAACSHDAPSTAPTKPVQLPGAATSEVPRIELVEPSTSPGAHVAGRNVFAYSAETPPPRVRTKEKTEVAQLSAGRPQSDGAEKSLEEKKPLDFPYRYIGRFGPREAQLAAFVADGEVTLARAGDVIGGGKYLVRAVGLETVEVALVGSPHLSRTLDIGQ